MEKNQKKITIKGTTIRLNRESYINLTDIARKFNARNPSILIANWLKNKDTIDFLGTWEEMHNTDFKLIEFYAFKNKAGANRFSLSVSEWTSKTNAIGIFSNQGRYGGTYAHQDITLGFCWWLSPSFQLYVTKEFQRLKELEMDAVEQDTKWHLQRLTDKIEEARNLLDTIPLQNPERNRIRRFLEEE